MSGSSNKRRDLLKHMKTISPFPTDFQSHCAFRFALGCYSRDSFSQSRSLSSCVHVSELAKVKTDWEESDNISEAPKAGFPSLTEVSMGIDNMISIHKGLGFTWRGWKGVS